MVIAKTLRPDFMSLFKSGTLERVKISSHLYPWSHAPLSLLCSMILCTGCPSLPSIVFWDTLNKYLSNSLCVILVS